MFKEFVMKHPLITAVCILACCATISDCVAAASKAPRIKPLVIKIEKEVPVKGD